MPNRSPKTISNIVVFVSIAAFPLILLYWIAIRIRFKVFKANKNHNIINYYLGIDTAHGEITHYFFAVKVRGRLWGIELGYRYPEYRPSYFESWNAYRHFRGDPKANNFFIEAPKE